MKQQIEFMLKGSLYKIPNSWNALNEYQFVELVNDIYLMSVGKLAPGTVKIRYVCRHMGWELARIEDTDAMANVVCLAEQITFPFLLAYPNQDEALAGLDEYTYRLCKRVAPDRLTGLSIARYLSKFDYHYVADMCFCHQFIPGVLLDIDGNKQYFEGYKIDTSFGMLTCTLTAQQFIEARELADCTDDQLPLLAAILYAPLPYHSHKSHELAERFKQVDKKTLQAIRYNFKAFVNYLFTKTEFSLLTAARVQKTASISTGAQEALYNLSTEGYGNLHEVSQTPVIPYLSILRKKIIESVRSLHAAKLNAADIAEQTGLPIHIITDIV
jgi:hypothetical protein